MLFSSYQFLLGFLPAAVLITWFADRNERWRTWTLVALSLIFYSYWDVRFLPLIAGSILFNWWMAGLFTARKQHVYIRAAIIVDLLALGIFKYTNFFAETFTGILGLPPARFEIALPLGISFFTFHHIMYLVDLGRGRAPIVALDKYALYICFFPQAIAGPIARWNEVIHQFGRRVFAPGWQQQAALGIAFVVIGLAQKLLLADPLGKIVDPIYHRAAAGAVTDGSAWLAMAFAWQVFFDFSGYSDMAIGLALIFGVQLPRNFDAPFRASSMVEFWQRWHMTLARFLRDYVFTPLSRIRLAGARHRMAGALAAILLTMGLCGLWHGAGWHYVLWGLLQGVGIVLAAWWSRSMRPLPSVVGWALTIGFFVVTIVLFRAQSLTAAANIYRGFAYPPIERDGLRTIAIAALCATALPASHVVVTWLTAEARRSVAAGFAVTTLIALLVISRFSGYEFIYFQF
jgi:D-alanyl-lipoteichoic acid acyltransferase DltB (MBOAT superfamily)